MACMHVAAECGTLPANIWLHFWLAWQLAPAASAWLGSVHAASSASSSSAAWRLVSRPAAMLPCSLGMGGLARRGPPTSRMAICRCFRASCRVDWCRLLLLRPPRLPAAMGLAMRVCEGGLLRINGSEMSPRNGVVVAHATCARVRRRGFVACCTQVLAKREEGAIPPPPATRPKCGRLTRRGALSSFRPGLRSRPLHYFDLAACCTASYRAFEMATSLGQASCSCRDRNSWHLRGMHASGRACKRSEARLRGRATAALLQLCVALLHVRT